VVFVFILGIAKKHGGKLYVVEDFPHTTQTLSVECCVTELEMVTSIELLKKMKMMDEYAGVLFISGWEEHQSEERLNKIREYDKNRKRKDRAKTEASIDGVEVVEVEDAGVDTEKAQTVEMAQPVQAQPARNNKKDYSIFQAEFNAFWEAYPRKVEKKKALIAYIKARTAKHSAEAILGAITEQTEKDFRYRPIEKVPHATTWLNGDRWTDVISTAPPVPRPPANSGAFLNGAY
jgi:hypothetical protein